jgi:hypothetical protein
MENSTTTIHTTTGLLKRRSRCIDDISVPSVNVPAVWAQSPWKTELLC